MPTLINLSLRNFLSTAFDAHDSWYGAGGGSAAYTAFFDTASRFAHHSGLKDIDLISRAEWELSRMRLHRKSVESNYQKCDLFIRPFSSFQITQDESNNIIMNMHASATQHYSGLRGKGRKL